MRVRRDCARLFLEVSGEGMAQAMEDRIEDQVDITADLGRVWGLVTRPGWWVPADLEEPEPPASHALTPGYRTVRESAKWGRFPVELVRIDPRTYVAFRWASQFPGQELEPGRSTLIEFFVEPLAGAVRVTVKESGFALLDAPESVREAGLADNTEGWRLELAELRQLAQAAPAG
jgi:uncharacterized protein YndB with AHSA1/START domain